MNHPHWLIRLNSVLTLLAALFLAVSAASSNGFGYLMLSGLLWLCAFSLFVVRKLLTVFSTGPGT